MAYVGVEDFASMYKILGVSSKSTINKNKINENKCSFTQSNTLQICFEGGVTKPFFS